MVRLPGNMPDGNPVASELGRKAHTRERGRNYGTSRPPFLLLWVGRWAKNPRKGDPRKPAGEGSHPWPLNFTPLLLVFLSPLL